MAEANILLVDDNPKYLKDALPFYGYKVDVATDGIEALHLIEKSNEKYDLILLDIMMPNMDGWTTLNKIRKNKKTEHVPVIIITAINEEQKMISGLKNGADDYIVKPFILPNLLARMEAILRRSTWQHTDLKNKSTKKNTDQIKISLTEREKEVLALVSKGANNKQIADSLVLREVTVKTHLNSIFKKLKVSNRTQAVLLAIEMDLIN